MCNGNGYVLESQKCIYKDCEAGRGHRSTACQEHKERREAELLSDVINDSEMRPADKLQAFKELLVSMGVKFH